MSQKNNAAQMRTILNFCYEKAVNGLADNRTCQQLADEYLEKYKTPELAAKKLIDAQISKCTAAGLLAKTGNTLNLGGEKVPANVVSTLYMQIRMVGAIAVLGGAQLNEENVKNIIYRCMEADSLASDISKAGEDAAEKLMDSKKKTNQGGKGKGAGAGKGAGRAAGAAGKGAGRAAGAMGKGAGRAAGAMGKAAGAGKAMGAMGKAAGAGKALGAAGAVGKAAGAGKALGAAAGAGKLLAVGGAGMGAGMGAGAGSLLALGGVGGIVGSVAAMAAVPLVKTFISGGVHVTEAKLVAREAYRTFIEKRPAQKKIKNT